MKKFTIFITLIFACVVNATEGHEEFNANGELLATSNSSGGAYLFIKGEAAKVIFAGLRQVPTQKFKDFEERSGQKIGCSHVYADDYYVCGISVDAYGY